ncbi:MAG: zinc ribbon domain-containing protein [Pseudomonadota bacterium]
MPIYEYKCESCGAHIEKLQAHGSAPISKCEHCGATQLKKIVSLTSFKLKGTGWYETDFKHKNSASENKPKTSDTPAKEKTTAAKKSSTDKQVSA